MVIWCWTHNWLEVAMRNHYGTMVNWYIINAQGIFHSCAVVQQTTGESESQASETSHLCPCNNASQSWVLKCPQVKGISRDLFKSTSHYSWYFLFFLIMSFPMDPNTAWEGTLPSKLWSIIPQSHFLRRYGWIPRVCCWFRNPSEASNYGFHHHKHRVHRQILGISMILPPLSWPTCTPRSDPAGSQWPGRVSLGLVPSDKIICIWSSQLP